MKRTESWVPDLVIGLSLAVFGLAEALRTLNALSFGDDGKLWVTFVATMVVALGFAAAAGLYRLAPGIALLLVWVAGGFQLITSSPVLLMQLAAVLVAFGTARYGSTAVVWASALSIPLGAFTGLLVLRAAGWSIVDTVLGQVGRSVGGSRLWIADGLTIGLAAVAGLVLFVPWLLGLVLRVRARAGETEAARQVAVHQAEQAQEIARLREEQAGLARDVHDVVGHSLAVILAQAESAQFRGDTDTQALKQSMRDIATSARSSLQDVRHVLSGTADATTQATGGLDSLIDGVRASGHEVAAEVTGTPRPLPPELDVVSYRVLQEMLTNAIKHGRRSSPLSVTRAWGATDLRIEVTNATDDPAHEAGQGLIGMQRRLDAVGGRLDVLRSEGAFTALATIPVRPS